MLVKEIGAFDEKVCKVMLTVNDMQARQKDYISNSMANTQALLSHFSCLKGVIAGGITGLPFDIEKSFKGEASCTMVGSLFVKDPHAHDRLLDAIIRSTSEDDTIMPFGKFTEAMYACFSREQTESMLSVFLSNKHNLDDVLLGVSLTCKMVKVEDYHYEKLGSEIIYRVAEHKYMCSVFNILREKQQDTESVRIFKDMYGSTWKNAWFVPDMTWIARDVFCCMHVFVSTDHPMTAVDFSRFVQYVSTSVLIIPTDLVFRLRLYSMGETGSICPEHNEREKFKGESFIMKRLCGLLAKAMTINKKHGKEVGIRELVDNTVDSWYSEMILGHDDVVRDIHVFMNHVRFRIKPMLEQCVQKAVHNFMIRKYNILTDGMSVTNDFASSSSEEEEEYDEDEEFDSDDSDV